MQLNYEELHLFFEGMKNSREQHAEENKSFEYGLNGRLHSRNGKLSYSSIKGTIEVYNDPNIVKYLGYFAFFDELVILVKYDAKVVGDSEVTTNESITNQNIVINIPFGGVQYNFTNEISLNAIEEIITISTPILPIEPSPLENNYDETIEGETIDLSYYYSLGSTNVPDYSSCNIGGLEDVPEYNKTYADAIIVLKKKGKLLEGRIAWLGNMNWDINRKITTVGIYENNYYKRIYFTDNLNPLRVFNLKDNSLNYRIAEEFSINQKATLLQPIISEITDNGSIKAMSVQYAYLLITENGQATPFSPYSELQLIVKDSDGYDFQGGEIEEKTTKSVKIKCPIISTLYKEVQAIAIEYEADTIPTSIRNLGKKDVAEVVEFLHTGNESEYIENITLDDIIETDNIWTYCNDITTKNNKLIAAGLRNEPYALQEKYISDLFLFKGWDESGATHNSLINPAPQTYDHFDPTNTEQSLYLKKQLFIRFLFFGNTTLTLRNKLIPGSEKSITFTSSSDQYIEYIDDVYDWLQTLDLTDFPNLTISRSNKSILFSPTIEATETDFSDYIFETSVSQVIIDFENEWAIKEPAVDTNKLIYGAQSYGFNRGSGIRVSWNEVKEPILLASPELYTSGPIMDLQTPSLKKTFVKDEIYRISCQFFKNGNPLFAIVCGDIKTPKIGAIKKYIDSSGEVVISSEMYSNQSERTETDETGKVTLALMVHRLEMLCEVRIPCEFKELVDSFQIHYVERTENNRTVLGQGISAPLVRIASFAHPSQAGINFAPNVYDKWTLPFNGGPLYGIHGLLQVYDDPDYGENWNDMNSFNNDWDDSQAVKDRVMRREIPNRKMFYFDCPDMIHGRISDKNINNGKIQVLGRLNTDHTQNLIRSRYPYDEVYSTSYFWIQGHPSEGIHEHYEVTGKENSEDETHNELCFSKKLGYNELGGVKDKKPYTVNISVFSKFTHYSAEHEVEKSSELVNKGQILPSAVLGTSFESINMALTFFAQHAYNSSLWLSGVYDNGKDRYLCETGQSSNQSEGYPTLFIRTKDDVFTNAFIGEHVTDPIYVKAHTWEGNSKNVDINGSLGNFGNWIGVPQTDSHALINIKLNNEASIYGGRNKYAFSQNIFIPLSKVIPIKGATGSNISQIFNVEGDFYTSLYIRTKNDYTNPVESVKYNMHQNNNYRGNDSEHSVNDWNRSGAWAYAVVLETEVESRLSGEYRFYRSDGAADFSITLSEAINSAYFKKNNLRIYNSVPWNFKDDPLLTNILSASKTKLNGDIFDAWTKFLLNEFYELEKAKGIITNVTNFGDEIYAIQEFESNKVNIDTSDFITTEAGQRVSVQKGTGQTFTSHEKLSDFGTSIRRALAEGEFGFSFFDEYNKAFVKIAVPLSLEKEIQQKLQELFNDDPIIDTEGYYDTEYKETNIRIRTEKGNTYMLSYNELLGVFNGYLEYNNDIYIMYDKRVFAPIRGMKTVQIICPEITSSLSMEINVGEYFTYQITADNNPDSYDAVGLPSGVEINKNTGFIYGIIDTPGTYNIEISVTNGCGTDTLTLVAEAVQLAPIITSPCFDAVQAGNPFSYQIVAINNPTSYNATNLPSGLTISPTGLISGTLPLTSGTWTITLSAENAVGISTKICDLVIENLVTNCDKVVRIGNTGTYSYVIDIGTGIGKIGITYNAFSKPVRFRLEYNNVIVADSKYVGYDNYYASLISEGINPSDIYLSPLPGTGLGQLLYQKTTMDPQQITIYVDAPLINTPWNFVPICPQTVDKVNNVYNFLNSCRTEFTIFIKVPAGATRTVKFTGTFAPNGIYQNPTRFQTGTIVTSDFEDTITQDTEYTVGINGDNSLAPSNQSSILAELKDGATVIHSRTLTRAHGPGNC